MGTNSFDIEEIQYYLFSDESDFVCHMCGGNAIQDSSACHHIFGRGVKEDDCESSILNCAPLHNNICHINMHGLLMERAEQERLFKLTLAVVLRNEYEFTEKDERFIEKYNLGEIVEEFNEDI